MKKISKKEIENLSMRVGFDKNGQPELIPSWNTILSNLTKYVDILKKERDEAYKALETFNKDKEIQKLNNKIDSLIDKDILRFTDKEKEAYENFWKKHEKCHLKGKGCSKIQIEITGTGIGNCYKLTCPICGKSEDITDTTSW